MSTNWRLCCSKAPKEEIIYCCQLFIAFVIIVVGLANITLTDNNTCTWNTLISGATGYLLPSPALHRLEPVLSDPPIQLLDAESPEQHGGQVRNDTT